MARGGLETADELLTETRAIKAESENAAAPICSLIRDRRSPFSGPSFQEGDAHELYQNRMVRARHDIGGRVISAAPASASDADPLLIKVINDDPTGCTERSISRVAAQAGHPVTVWITDRAVRIASKERAGNLGEQQHMFNELLKQRLGSSCALCA
jgi:hypothetical protein